MKASPYLQIIEKDGCALCWHALRGNLYFLEPDYLDALRTGKSDNINIIHDLAEAGYLVDEGINERDFLTHKNMTWMELVPNGGQLRMLNLMISEVCNFGCQHCLHRCSIEVSPTHGKKLIMDWETAKAAIDVYTAIMRLWNRPIDVHFGSAEPLLNYGVVKRAITYFRQLDPRCKLAVNTNLSLLTREMAEFFRDHQVFISTSLDGPPEGNDAMRQFKDQSGTYATIISRFNLLKDIGYPLDGFSITLNDLNFDLVTPEFIAWAHTQGFTGIATDIDLINMTNARRSIEECVAKLLELRSACLDLGIENFGSWTTAYDNLVNEPEDDMPTFCKAAKGQNLSINAEGLIFICGHTTTPIGKLDDIDEVLTSDSPYVKLVASRLPGNDPSCFGCEIEGVCAGQCQITREVAKATGNARDLLLCQFYRLATRRLLERKLVLESANP